MNKYKILVLVHRDLIPPPNINSKNFDRDSVPWDTEYDVIVTLKELGHEVSIVGLLDNIDVLKNEINTYKPHLIFNLLEEFDGQSQQDQHVVSYLELLRIPYTGCAPRGLTLARDKGLSKKILQFHNVKCPNFTIFQKNKPITKPKGIIYPIIVKSLIEEASFGMSQASLVKSDEKLKDRIEYLTQKLDTDVIAEEFIEGREFFIGILGNKNLTNLPIWELFFANSKDPDKEFYSTNAKFNKSYRARKGIKTKKAILDSGIEKEIIHTAKVTYKALELSGYARIDLRITKDNTIHVLEANPNPNISKDDEFALSANEDKISYPELLNKIITLGLNRS